MKPEKIAMEVLNAYEKGLKEGREDMSIKVNEIINRECRIWKRGFKEYDTVLENFKEKIIYEVNNLTKT